MKEAIITAVGLAGYNKKAEKYNTLEFMIDEFGDRYEIIFYTDESLKAQREVFKESIKKIEKFLLDFKDNYYQNPLYLARFNTVKILFNKKYLLNAITFLEVINNYEIFLQKVIV